MNLAGSSISCFVVRVIVGVVDEEQMSVVDYDARGRYEGLRVIYL